MLIYFSMSKFGRRHQTIIVYYGCGRKACKTVEQCELHVLTLMILLCFNRLIKRTFPPNRIPKKNKNITYRHRSLRHPSYRQFYRLYFLGRSNSISFHHCINQRVLTLEKRNSRIVRICTVDFCNNIELGMLKRKKI